MRNVMKKQQRERRNTEVKTKREKKQVEELRFT